MVYPPKNGGMEAWDRFRHEEAGNERSGFFQKYSVSNPEKVVAAEAGSRNDILHHQKKKQDWAFVAQRTGSC